ncbi:hypothetical protein JCM8208_003973 [Rhodotorula glutinis]
MHAFALLATIASLAVASASTSPAFLPPGANAVSAPTDISLDKRTICFLGICLGETAPNYTSDVNNCGVKGNRCPSGWLFGGGSQCISGQCAPAYCNNLFDFNWGSRQCQDVSSDTQNCGKCGQTCSVANAKSSQCVSGSCFARECLPGFSLASGTCVKTIDTTSDMMNCGSLGNKCPTSWANGVGATCSSGVCRPSTCVSGWSFDLSARKCQNTGSDVNNCGSVGNRCSFPGGFGSCKSGQCTYDGCNDDCSFLGGICKKLDFNTDVENCGGKGRKCSYDNGIASCSSGQCSLSRCADGFLPQTSGLLWWATTTCEKISCSNGFVYDPSTKACRNTQTDASNCGALGRVCPAQNGVAKCWAGQCSVDCESDSVLVQGVCQKADLLNDASNCGKVGLVCPKTYANGGKGSCRNGVCSANCDSLFDFDVLFGFCRDVSQDKYNCGRCGQTCNLPGATSTACKSGQCYATQCSSGYTLANGRCSAADTTSDAANCGRVGYACQFSPSGATGVCKNSQCVTTGCPAGYSLASGVCVKQNPSAQARLAKKDKIEQPKKLCPAANEQACPILGSSSYAQAVEHHFAAVNEFSGVMLGAGGYECLDTTTALDSCGGCASTGEGMDCTKIRGVQGVGCEGGVCRVFSCEAGWKPSLRGDKCVRARTSHAGLASNGTQTTTARQHVAGRHAHHGLPVSH